MKRITKHFPGVRALSSVDFRYSPRGPRPHGAKRRRQKSTLVKVLTGVHPADAGEILLDGRAHRAVEPLDAQKLGISTVYQEVNLCPNLSVAENI